MVDGGEVRGERGEGGEGGRVQLAPPLFTCLALTLPGL